MKITSKTKKKIYKFVGGILAVVVVYILNEYGLISTEDAENNALANVEQGYIVSRVVDGDTLVVTKDGVDTKVRLIGVNTPESVHPDEEKNTEFGKISSDYTKEKLLNKTVELELDVQEKDQYGRTLAYVYIDGVMFNKMLLQDGMAQVATYPPNVKYVEDFEAIQVEARENKVGLWSDEYAVND